MMLKLLTVIILAVSQLTPAAAAPSGHADKDVLQQLNLLQQEIETTRKELLDRMASKTHFLSSRAAHVHHDHEALAVGVEQARAAVAGAVEGAVEGLTAAVRGAGRAVEERLNDTALYAVSFTVAAGTLRTYIPGATLRWDREVTNEGGYFDMGANMFTCPVTGVYLFSLSARTLANLHIDAVIRVNGDNLITAAANGGRNDEHFDMGSTSATGYCEEGWEVEVSAPLGGTVLGGNNHFTAFSGHLLYIIPTEVEPEGLPSVTA